MKYISTDILKTSNYYLWDIFKNDILGDIKKVPVNKIKVTATKITKDTHDSEIMAQTGTMTREECLALIIDLTQKQKNGEEGVLSHNGYSNIIGYVKLDDGRVLTVNAFWHSGHGQWNCYGDEPYGWDAGGQFLSRNGSKALSPDEPWLPSSLTLEKAIEVCKNNGLVVYKPL